MDVFPQHQSTFFHLDNCFQEEHEFFTSGEGQVKETIDA